MRILDTQVARDHALTVVVLGGCLLTFFLGGRGLNPDGAFYAQKAKEILASGDWITMHFNGRPDFQHPPLPLWMEASSSSVVGVGEGRVAGEGAARYRGASYARL